jgi:hypothetical protein
MSGYAASPLESSFGDHSADTHDPPDSQAKELEIYETQPFLKSALFVRNGYSVDGKEIVKRFERRRVVDEDEEM